jgi:CHAD domain-containing protein
MARRGKPLAWKAKPSGLAPDNTVDDAIALILDNCLAQVIANHAAAKRAYSTEGVHQMRVGLRRLRAALKVLHKEIPAESFVTFSAGAETLADGLGPVRNLDALAERLSETDLKQRMTGPQRRALREAIKGRRAALHGELRAALQSEATRRFLDGLSGWIAARQWRTEIAEEKLPLLALPVRHLAEAILDALERKARKRGRGFRHQLPVHRHKFRIAIQKLRYAAKFFAPLHAAGAKAPERYLARLSKLQDALGEDHDAVVTPILLKELGRDSRSAPVHRAILALKRALARRQPALRKELRKRRHQWKQAKTFW